MQDHPAESHQIITQPAAPPPATAAPPSTWISQPTATVTAACIVLIGVILTLWQNANRLRNEQLEKRAKDKEQRRLELFGDFAATGLQVIRRLEDVYAGRRRQDT